MVFSDNHGVSEYGKTQIGTWLKGATDYESIRLGTSDPESRIHLGEKAPHFRAIFD